ncbi:MAG TPA: hypothetical protein VGD60_04935, partial [Candidatus Acidoferrales bacterium]
AARFTEEDLTRFFNTLMTTDAELRRAPDPRLHLELGLLKMINAKRLAPLEEVLANLRDSGAAPARPAAGGGSTNPLAKTLPTSARGAAETTQAVSSSGAAVKMAPVPAFKIEPKASTITTSVPTPVVTTSAATSTAPKFVVEPRSAVPSSAAVAAPIEMKAAPAATTVAPVVNRGSNAVTVAEAAAVPVAAPAASGGANVLSAEQIAQIRAALTGSKFLLSMLDEVTGWETANGELRLFFHPDSRSLSEMLQAKDPMERLRTALQQVLGQALRVCVKLDASRTAPAAPNSELKARFEQDPIVRAMLEKFGGQISNVKRPGGN